MNRIIIMLNYITVKADQVAKHKKRNNLPVDKLLPKLQQNTTVMYM